MIFKKGVFDEGCGINIKREGGGHRRRTIPLPREGRGGGGGGK